MKIELDSLHKTVGFARHNVSINTLSILNLSDATAYALAKASDLPSKTIYTILSDVDITENLNFFQTKTLKCLAIGLSSISRDNITVNELLSDSNKPKQALEKIAQSYEENHKDYVLLKGELLSDLAVLNEVILSNKPKPFTIDHLVLNSGVKSFKSALLCMAKIEVNYKKGIERIRTEHGGSEIDEKYSEFTSFKKSFLELSNKLIHKHMYSLSLPDFDDIVDYPEECKKLIDNSEQLISRNSLRYSIFGGNLKEELDQLADNFKQVAKHVK